MKRSKYAGSLRAKDVGNTVVLAGWTHKRRAVGSGLIFLILRDSSGIAQITVDEALVSEESFAAAKEARGEYVIIARGEVKLRSPENINSEMPTGEIEVIAREIKILSEAITPPFSPLDKDVANDLRMKYRYIDLRREEAAQILRLRSKIGIEIRRYLDENGFIETETPTLTRSTPEGARDYIIPSRTNKGSFYALPQSPQLFKQLLMLASIDKYYQFAKCYRDEDLRADRQPEFTQIDIEMAFSDEEDVFALTEGLIARAFLAAGKPAPETPFARLTYTEAMKRFGSDKPDMRFGLEIRDVSEAVRGAGFEPFDNASFVYAINAPIILTRKQTDALSAIAKEMNGVLGVVNIKDGQIKSPLLKFLGEERLANAAKAPLEALSETTVLLCAGSKALEILGVLRLSVAKICSLVNENVFAPVWVTEMPLLEYSEEDKRYYAAHHPFTQPLDFDLDLIEKEPGLVRARAYDLVINGFEAGGGSVRINDIKTQILMLKNLGFSEESAKASFGFFLEALQYGAPPHCGIALGFDRLVMILSAAESLREVIAFPKAKDGSCPLTGAPYPVEEAQLKEVGL